MANHRRTSNKKVLRASLVTALGAYAGAAVVTLNSLMPFKGPAMTLLPAVKDTTQDFTTGELPTITEPDLASLASSTPADPTTTTTTTRKSRSQPTTPPPDKKTYGPVAPRLITPAPPAPAPIRLARPVPTPRVPAPPPPPLVAQPQPPKVMASSSVASFRSKFFAVAQSYLGRGIPYVWGGKSANVGFDCSGFIWDALKRLSPGQPYRSSSELNTWTMNISQAIAEPGDLVFWSGHAAIYAGNGKVITQGGPGPGPTTENLWPGYSFGRIPL